MRHRRRSRQFPGVKRLRLTAATGSKNYGQITTTGHLRDVYRRMRVIRVHGELQRIPTTSIQVVVIRGSDGTTAADVYVSVKHEAYTELQLVDAIVS